MKFISKHFQKSKTEELWQKLPHWKYSHNGFPCGASNQLQIELCEWKHEKLNGATLDNPRRRDGTHPSARLQPPNEILRAVHFVWEWLFSGFSPWV
jgi:hypothetical protein